MPEPSTVLGSAEPVEQAHIRNFVIIAHIDHGKSTLADRLLERTGTVAHLDIIPIINKIDLPSAQTEVVREEIERVIGLPGEDCILASAKQGIGVDEILEAIVSRIPPPHGDAEAPLRALIFDSHYDAYKGVIAYCRFMDGAVRTAEPILMMSAGVKSEAMEVGIFHPTMMSIDRLVAGEVGYIATGLKDVRDVRVGDTITSATQPAVEALPGYRPAKSMVFAGLYPTNGEDYPLLREALERLKLNDASLVYE